VIDHIEAECEDGFAKAKARFHTTEETGHGRKEIRSYMQMPVPKNLKGLELWKGLKSIGMATLVCVRNGEETTERRYYISSLAMGEAIRAGDPQSLGDREWLSLEFGYDLPRRRIPHPRAEPAGETLLG